MKNGKPTIVLVRAAGIDDGNRCIPFGLLDIQSFLEKQGHQALIMDRHLFIEPIHETVKKVMSFNPPFVGISAMTAQMPDALKFLRALRNRGYAGKIIFGGTHVTFDSQSVRRIVDYVIRKEGELAIKAIIENENPSLPPIIDGKPLCNLDEIPIPEVETFRQVHPAGIEHFNILTARGCPFKCSFCLSPEQREVKMRVHSVDYVIETIRRICEAVPARKMFIMDDIFTLNKDRVMDFCEKLKKSGLNLSWWCFTHVRYGDAQMYRAMKEAGCLFVSMGVESGNEEVLRLNHKNITPRQAKEKAAEIVGSGLNLQVQFLMGLLGDTIETMRDTIDLALEIREMGAGVACGFAQPYPGTEMFEKAKQYGRFLTTDKRLYFRKFITYLPKGVSLGQMLELHFQFERAKKDFRFRKGMNMDEIKHRVRHWPIYYYYDFFRRRIGWYDFMQRNYGWYK